MPILYLRNSQGELEPIPGMIGPQGAQGAPGPNEITTATATPLSGVLVGEDNHVREGEPGVDFAAAEHDHGAISSDGKVGTAAGLPLFTDEGGAVGTKTKAQARAALGLVPTTILADIALSVGGYITNDAIAAMQDYSLFGVTISGAGLAICVRVGGVINGLANFQYSYTDANNAFHNYIYQDVIVLILNNDYTTLTYYKGDRITHISGGQHGTILASANITQIVGLA